MSQQISEDNEQVIHPNEKENNSQFSRQVSIQLTPEQFERLYLQPGGEKSKGDLTKILGNPTALGVGCFVLTLTPLSLLLMRIRHVDSTGLSVYSAVMFMVGGIGLWISGILEFILGNTFPFVFASFGSFWLSFAYIASPQVAIASAYPNGSNNEIYNATIAAYLVAWGFMTFIYMIASVRTNAFFAMIFLTITLAFFILAGGYYDLATANTERGMRLFRASGACCFICAISGWWIFFSLILDSTGMPVKVPLLDLSTFVRGRRNI